MTGGSYEGGIAHAEKSECDGFFLLAWRPAQILTGGSLGRGSAECTARFTTRFTTEEGRTYFMQAEACREVCAQLACDLEDARRQLRKIADKKEKRRQKRLKKLGRP